MATHNIISVLSRRLCTRAIELNKIYFNQIFINCKLKKSTINQSVSALAGV